MSDGPPVPDPDGHAAPDSTIPLRSLAASGRTLGSYLLRERIGEGGMGEVWRAEQTHPVRRTVALKLIKAGMDSREVLARFEAERQALALMDHPCIAKVFDAGTTPEGRPYFAMEYVPGMPITTYCDKRRLSTRERLELFQRVCEGVQHAHQKAVLHRDLKPGNVLVEDVDGKPLPKIIDFGVAKATTQKLTEKTMYTALGQLIGTPEYMSPEQAELTGEDVDTRTDVYSLGVILYELLVGALPFDPKELRRAGFEGIIRILREQDPPRPSTKLSTLGEDTTRIAASRRTGPRRLSSQLRGELDWIVMRSLEKDRNRRYGSPKEMAQDIQRHLDDEPVLAGPPSASYRTRKFVRRHRLGVGVASTAFVVLAAFATTTLVQSRQIANERDRANREAEASERVSTFLAEMLGNVDPHRLGTAIYDDLHHRIRQARSGDGPEAVATALSTFESSMIGVTRADVARDLLREEILTRATKTIEEDLQDQPLIAARLYQTLGNTYSKLGMAEDAVAQLEQAVEIRARELGAEHPSTLEARHDHAAVQAPLLRGDPENDALELMRGVIEARRRVLGAEHPQTLESMYRLGVLVHETNPRAEADSIHQAAWQARRRVLGEDHPATLYSMHAAADMCWHMKRWDEADSLFGLVLEKQRSILGPEHEETLACMLDMAYFYSYSLGRHDKGAQLLEQVLETRRRLLGNDHHQTLYTAGVLADVLGGARPLAAWRRADAVRLDEELLETRRRIWGDRHLQTAQQAIRVALHYMYTGREDEADALFDDAIEVERSLLEPDHETILSALQIRGAANRIAGRYDQAVEILEDVLADRRRVLAEKGKPPIEALLRTYEKLERYEDAEQLYRERIGLLEQDPGPNPATLLYWKQELARLYKLWERYDEAETLLRTVVDGRDVGDRDTLVSLALLAQVLDATGRPSEARPLYEAYARARIEEVRRTSRSARIKYEVVRSLLENVPAEHLDVEGVLEIALDLNESTSFTHMGYLSALALAYHHAGRHDEAVDTQRTALAKMHPKDPYRPQEEAKLREYEGANGTR